MPRVTIYTTTTCPFCKMEKEYLTSKSIPFSEILVDQDPQAAQKMIEISGQMGVPFTVIDTGQGKPVTILGFDRQKIDQTLGLVTGA